MYKKKIPKGVFHGPAGGSFSQKKKIVLEKIKHFDNKKNIFLSKSESGNNVYFNANSLLENNESINMTDISGGSLLGSAANTLKANSSLSSFNFVMDDNEKIDLKVIKTQIDVAVKKLFALDINFSVVKDKLAMAKTQVIRKLFSIVYDWVVVIKKILIDTPKKIIVVALSKFVHVTITVGDRNTWASKNCFRALLFTLSMGTTAHNFDTLLDKVDEKTCIINYSLESGNQICCTIIGFKSDNKLESTRLDLVQYEKYGRFGHSALECDIPNVLVFLSLKTFKRTVFVTSHLQLARLYAKKNVFISCSAAFDGKFWAQVVLVNFSSYVSSISFSASSFFSGVLALSGPYSSVFDNVFSLCTCLVSLKCSLELLTDQIFGLIQKFNNVEMVLLASLLYFCSLTDFSPTGLDSNMDLVLGNFNMVLSPPPLPSISNISVLGQNNLCWFSFYNVETVVCWLKFLGLFFFPMSCLVWKFAIYNVKNLNNLAKQNDAIRWHKNSCNSVSVFTKTKLKNSEHFGLGVVIVLNKNFACYMCKILEIPGHLISVYLLFAGRASVTILGLYAGVSAGVRFE
ncbi:hypothetical protein G9A89_018797 [Geosiphon pyriformis]|nr:hypothetical protein G9A89_018797 [Geosiphon pyriformis]